MAVLCASRVLASVAFVAFAGCAHPAAKAPDALDVDVARVRLGDLATTLRLDAQIAPLRESTLSTPQSGTLASVDVEEGDAVVRGQVLARLDDAPLRAQLAASVAIADQARAKISSASRQLPISSQQYASAASAASQGVDQARNRIATAEAALASTRLVYDSDRNLVAQGFVSRMAVESARANEVAAERELANARAALPAAQAGLETARSDRGQTAVAQDSLAGDRAALEQAEANVALARTALDETAIRAPFDGVVTARLLDPGAFAGPSQAIVRISQLSTVFVNATVPQDALGAIRPGEPAVVATPSLPGRTFRGTIGAVNPVPASGTLAYRARMRLPNPGGALRGGMLATVELTRDRRTAVPVVPKTAVATVDGRTGVFVVDGGRARFVRAAVGLQTDTTAQVTGPGLVPGTPVIITRPDALQDGSPVLASYPAGTGA